jgi:CDP-diacylglycerol--glycerol-3-phosphate 3-phosphatidyltransferase
MALEFKRDWHKPANVVTLFRLVLAWIPAAIILTNPKGSDSQWLAAILFVFVAATDILDGHLARSRGEITDLGKFIDPLIDKILVFVTLVALSLVTPILWIPTIVITVREIWVTIVLRRPAQLRGGVIAAVASGKIKMTLQCAMIVVLTIPGSAIWIIIQIALVIAAIGATIWSWIDYQRRFGLKK